MKRTKVTKRNKIEMLVGRVVINLIAGLLGTGAILGFFRLLGVVMSFIETHFWLIIPLGLIDFVLMLKMVSE